MAEGIEQTLLTGDTIVALSFGVDGFRIIYICVTVLLWAFSSIFSVGYFGADSRRGRYHAFSFLSLFATIGVFLSADLFTMFIFFELLSLLSYPMVAHDETPTALRAAETYLAVAVIAGMTMLMGLLLLRNLTGTLEIKLLHEASRSVGNRRMLYIAGALVLVGFGAKAGLFPLHIWLPKAHPAAPAPASALLSGVLTKCGVFGVIIVSCEVFRGDVNWGVALLAAGVATMLVGAVPAVFSVDLKRTLACSSVSQIGFIAVGIAMSCILGEHNALAVRGTILHMVNHSVFKLILFLSAGVVYMNVHSVDFGKIRGFARGKPLFASIFVIASAGIAGIPLFGGYISKTLLHESIVEGLHMFSGNGGMRGLLNVVEALFIVTGGLTVAYMLKILAVLFGRPADTAKKGLTGQKSGLHREITETAKTAESIDFGVTCTTGVQPRHRRKSGYIRLGGAAVLILPTAYILVSGLFPRFTESLAAVGQGFLHGHTPEHAVFYFAWGNLKGAGFSLAVGLAVYFLIIKPALTKKDTANGTVYVDRWPRRLDLENLVYRPFINAFVFACSFVARVLGALPDATVGLVRKTLLRPLKPGRFPGRFFGRYYSILRPENSEQPPVRTTVHAGFSVGLLLFGAGLCAILGYLLFVAFL